MEQGRGYLPHPALVRLRNGLRGDSHHVRYSSSTLKTRWVSFARPESFQKQRVGVLRISGASRDSSYLWALVGDKRKNLSVRHCSGVSAKGKTSRTE